MSQKQSYDFVSMTLGYAVTVLIDYNFNFEQIREMTFPEIVAAFERINAGELKTRTEIAAEKVKLLISSKKK